MIEARVVDFHHSMTVDDSHDPFLLTVSVVSVPAIFTGGDTTTC